MIRFILFIVLIFIGCDSNTSNEISWSEKLYTLDANGHVITTEIEVDDFTPATECKECHEEHYDEWQHSMHAYAMKDPVFFSGWNEEQTHRPNTGERFCIQCHSPVAFTTGTDLSEFETPESVANSSLPESIKEGIACDYCHSITGLSSTVHAMGDISANAEFHLFPGENIKFGSIQNPEPTAFHESVYLPIYTESDICLPCHDITVRGVEAEITFTEWSRINSLAMSGAFSCQDCHMIEKADGTHDHSFVGVDVDLSLTPEKNPQIDQINTLLASALQLDFKSLSNSLADTISAVDSLTIPIEVKSLTGHSIPSGVPFAREMWCEIEVTDESGDVVFSNGKIELNSTPLDYTDPELLLFTAHMFDENEDTTLAVTDVHRMENYSLPGMGVRYHNYYIEIPENSNRLTITATMNFRPFKPAILQGGHEDLLLNLPVFEMTTISKEIIIQE
jgi:hypothetical protein